MIAVDGPQQESQLHDLMAYLVKPRRPKIQILLRPYCPTHENVLMRRGKTLNGLAYYYCPCAGCRESWKGRKRVV